MKCVACGFGFERYRASLEVTEGPIHHQPYACVRLTREAYEDRIAALEKGLERLYQHTRFL